MNLETFKNIRKATWLSQTDFWKLLWLKRCNIAHIEMWIRKIHNNELYKLCELLNITPNELNENWNTDWFIDLIRIKFLSAKIFELQEEIENIKDKVI